MTQRSKRTLARLLVRMLDNDPETAWSAPERTCYVCGALHAWQILAERTRPVDVSEVRYWAETQSREA